MSSSSSGGTPDRFVTKHRFGRRLAWVRSIRVDRFRVVGAFMTGLIGPIELRLPSDAQLSRVARLAASGFAAMVGFDVGLIDDVKLAVSEVLLVLVEHGSGNIISLTLSAEGVALTVRGSTNAASFDLNHPDIALCRTVLGGIAVSHDIAYAGKTAEIWAVLRDLEA